MVREVPYIGKVGNSVSRDVGTGPGTVAAGDDPRLARAALVLNVLDFGAKADNSTNDTAAIQAALDAAAAAASGVYGTKAAVWFPSGRYRLDPVFVDQRVALRGPGGKGAVLKFRANQAPTAVMITNRQNYSGVTDAQGVDIAGLFLDGNKAQQPAGSWQSGILLRNDTPGPDAQWTDGRHTVADVHIENFTGSGFIQSGRGTCQVERVSVWACDGFGFDLDLDSAYSDCDAGGCGLDGFLVRGNNSLVGCKAWFCGTKLTTTVQAGQVAAARTVTPPAGWNHAGPAGVAMSLANGWGNGFLFATVSGTTLAGNFNGGVLAGCIAQDNARAGFSFLGGRQTAQGCQADSNSNNGSTTGANTGAQVGDFAGVEIRGDFGASHINFSGTSWDRGASNMARQSAALRITGTATNNIVSLTFRGTLRDGSAMPPMTADSITGDNKITMRAADVAYSAPAYSATWTPDPFRAAYQAMTLTGAVTVANAALGGAGAVNTGAGIFLLPGTLLHLRLVQDATGGRAVTWGSAYRLNGFAVNPAPGASSAVSFCWDGVAWQAYAGTYGGRDAFGRATMSQLTPAYPEAGAYHIAPNSGTSTGSGWVLGEVRFQKFTVPVLTPCSGLAVSTSVVAAGGTTPAWRMALYPDDGTGARPALAPPMAGTEVSTPADAGTGARDAAFAGGNMALPPGEYWGGCMLTSGGGTALTTVPTMTTANLVNAIGASNLTNVSHRGWAMSAGAAAAAMPTVSGLFRAGAPPIMGLKVAA